MTTQPTNLPIRYDFTVPNRVIVKETARITGIRSNMYLSDVHAELSGRVPNQMPTDHTALLSNLHVDFTSGHMEASFTDAGGDRTRSYLVSTTASHQLSGYVLPARFFSGLKELAKLDRVGADLATRTWNKFGSYETEKKRLVRTIKMALNKHDIRWVIRSVHSSDYAPYGHVDFVGDLMRSGADFAHMPVLSWTLTDNAMRIRFAAVSRTEAALSTFDPNFYDNRPVPMIEVWNSETGCRKTGLRAGLFLMKSLTAIPHWNERTEYNWIHRGNPERIRSAVGSAFHNLLTSANEVVDAYGQAEHIEVEEPDQFIEKMGRNLIAESFLTAAKKTLTENPGVMPGNKLGSIVDAMMFTAAEQTDIFEQDEVEKAASVMLHKGCDLAKKSGGSRIPCELF